MLVRCCEQAMQKHKPTMADEDESWRLRACVEAMEHGAEPHLGPEDG